MFNALRYTKQLEQVGLTREQAEAHIQIITEVMETNLATKSDMHGLKTDMKSEMDALRSDMKSDIAAVRSEMVTLRTELKSDMVQLEYRLMIKLGTLFSVIMTLGFTAISLVIKFQGS